MDGGLTRRDAITIAFYASGAMVIGCKPRRGSDSVAASTTGQSPTSGTFEQWIAISAEEDVVHVFVDRAEMGQGTTTMFASIVAEELRIDAANMPKLVRPVHASTDTRFRNPQFLLQVTGFSSSTVTSWGPLDKSAMFAAGLLSEGLASNALAEAQTAIASHLGGDLYNNRLRQAAAALREAFAKVGGGECKNLRVGNRTFREILSSRRAALQTAFDGARSSAKVTEPGAATIVMGKGSDVVGRPDIRAKIRGEAIYGMDAGIDPNGEPIRFAHVRRADYVQGHLGKPTDEWLSAANDHPEVKIFPIGLDDNGKHCRGIAIVSQSWWHAYQRGNTFTGLTQGAQSYIRELDNEKLSKNLRDLEGSGIATTVGGQRGTPRNSLAGAKTGRFEVPYVPHAAIEPLNCTVKISGSRCEIWLGTQAPEAAVEVARQITRLSDVVLHPVDIGGSFGRRLSSDFVAEAVEIANHPSVRGQKVKLIWSREDEFRHDFYRPAALNVITASRTPSGDQITDWDHQTISQSITAYLAEELSLSVYGGSVSAGITDATGRIFGATLNRWVKDPFTGEGGRREDLAYNTDRFRMTQVPYRKGRGIEQVPVGYWRSVSHSHTAFAVESMIDVLAGDMDPLDFRIKLYNASSHPDRARCLNVAQTLKATAEANRGIIGNAPYGVAIHRSFGTTVGYLVYPEIVDDKVRVKFACAVIDCGFAVNPDVVKQQVEGGFIYGLSAALKQSITLKGGVVQEMNFHHCDLIRMNESPQIIVSVVPSNERPSGVGEPVVAPVAPALANALARMPGVGRPYKLPIRIKGGKVLG